MIEVCWDRYPRLAKVETARSWLRIQVNLGLAGNTVEAYGRALDDYLAFSAQSGVDVLTANREHISNYVRDLSSRRHPKRPNKARAGLANATLQQRLTAVRLFYDHLMEEGLRANNPVGRGR